MITVKKPISSPSYQEMMTAKDGTLYRCQENNNVYRVTTSYVGTSLKHMPDTTHAVDLTTINTFTFIHIGYDN